MTKRREQAISAVVFDIGNVLIEWDPRHLYRKIFEAPEVMEAFLSDICTPAWNLEQDRGRSFAEGVAELIARHPEYEAEIRAFDERWGEMIPGVVRGTLALMERLEANGAPLYAITNFSAEKYEEARLRFPFFDRFRGTIVSGRERLVKPDRAIFELLLRRYGLNAADCLFIDDSSANIAAARSLGMATHHFRDAERLEAQLIESRLI
ncbi:MAG TPA: HAD family phosphatase [Roseiarcus sp.]|nr:HAD family phosphatase [Roseiarcus sp.]